MENRYIVYEHVSKDGKRYIGITMQDIRKRWRNGCGYKKNIHFYRAILKYGWDSFEHNILYSNISEEDAKRFERLLIEKDIILLGVAMIESHVQKKLDKK